jgi:broad specificity phosphatase PhoE
MKRVDVCVALVGWLLADVSVAFAESGFRGVVCVRTADGGIGAPVANADVRFLPEGGGPAVTARSDARGSYRVGLARGRYWAFASHPRYEDYSSVPGFFVVPGPGYQTGNFFLREPGMTTVLVLRHAEKGPNTNPDQQTPLSPAGEARARELAHVALKAGVSGIYVTEFLRTQQSAKPLADALQIAATRYSQPSSLVASIAAEHRGDVVLVVSHSMLVEQILAQLSGTSPSGPLTDEFDNLFLVTSGLPGGDVLHLQYAAASLPDSSPWNVRVRTTLLLVSCVEQGTAGIARGQALKQALGKAGVSAIYCNAPAAIVAAVAAASGLTPAPYSTKDVAAFAGRVLADHAGETVLIGARPKDISSIIRAVRGYPLIPVFTDEYDNLVVITVDESGDARVTSLQYGATSR